MVSVREALVIGTQHHQAGKLAEAEQIYRQIIEVEPRNAAALHQLGMLAMQARRFDAAVDLISRAIQSDRTQGAFHGNLGEAYRHLGQIPEAIESYRQAIKVQPTLAAPHIYLGTLLHETGRLVEAAAALRELLKLQPENMQARALVGRVLHEQRKFAEAETCFRRVLRADETSPDAHFDLGTVLEVQDKLNEAATCFRAALALQPDYPEAHINLGTVLQKQNKLAEASAQYEAAVKLRPDLAVAHHNLGSILESQGNVEAAIASYERAVRSDASFMAAKGSLAAANEKIGRIDDAWALYQEILQQDPQFVAAHSGSGRIHRLRGKLNLALAAAQEAIRLEPRNADHYNNLGVTWSDLGRRDEAVAAYRRAIELKKDLAVAHGNLGVSLQALGRLDEAIEEHRQAVALNPASAGLHGNLLYALNYHPSYDAQTLLREHRQWGQRHADSLTAQCLPHSNDRLPDRRLRVGYVSAHFLEHAVNFFSEPILAHHDHAQFEVFCYSNVERSDETTERLQGYADHWREIAWQSDEQMCELIRRDRIDILVDLTGHIGGNRLMVFARKPAPIQVTYIGYQNTTGMLAMDYRLTDEYSDPAGTTDAYYTERLVRLPQSFFCYLPSSNAPLLTPSPAATRGYVTFGSFNNMSKVTPAVLATWARLLLAVPDSRLVILGEMADSLRDHLTTTFTSHGVESDRLILANRRPRHEYLELINDVDIALDPFPFNGHTTTCDSLWQGVPVVTLSGDTYVSRFGGSALATLGLDDLIAHSADEYVGIATALAADRNRLGELRSGLRKHMANSPLLEFEKFTRNLEAEYRRIWRQWCES